MTDPRDTFPNRPARGAPATRADETLRRRAEALRENLKRRKAQARGRKAGAPEPDDGAGAAQDIRPRAQES